jgi:predicted ribosome quality control (RQC) complex YloA/Tae2 family protein
MAAIQPLDATGLRAVLAELRPALLPSRFEKAQQGDGRTLQIALRSLQGIAWLELSWLAEAPRLLAIAAPPRRGEGSTLARQLQHGLRGLALVAIDQPSPWERIVELGFAPRPGESVQRRLVLELMGRHSNLFLLDGERRVITLGHQVRAGQSRVRPIGTGDPWQPPPPPAGEPPALAEPEASWRRRLALLPLPVQQALMGAYQGISPALAAQLCADICPLSQPVTALEEPQWQALAARWRAWLDAVQHNRFQFSAVGERGWRCWAVPSPQRASAACAGDALPINRQLAAYYQRLLGEREQQRLRTQLDQRLRLALERERRQASELEQRLAAAAGSDALQQHADALLCQPSPPRCVIDQAQKLYQRARKLRRSRAAIEPRLEGHQRRIEALDTSLTFVEQAGAAELVDLEPDVLELLEREGGAGRPPRRQRRAATGGTPPPQPLELRTAAGLRLQVGRNHRQNEWISLRQARRGDLWFHAQEQPGSHVVLKASEAAAGDADLAAAADLAAHFSRGRGNGRVPVVMVGIEDLQRIPGAVPGTVRHRGGVVLWGLPERAQALLSARQSDTVQP